jgi:signal peptidase I
MIQRKKQQGWLAFITEILFLIGIIFLIRTVVFGLYQVPTGSMETTMLVGERFFAEKFTYLFRDPKHKEIISFNDPTYPYSKNSLVRLWQDYVGRPTWTQEGFGWIPSNWTKRVIGTPGQTVKGVVENGKTVVYVDGTKLDEPYLNKYPLLLVYPKKPEELVHDYKKQAELLVLAGRLPVSEFVPEVERQVYCSARQKSYDPAKPFNDQPFYDIDPSRVVRDKNGHLVLTWPATPLENPNSKICPVDVQEGNYWNGTDEFCVKLKNDEFWVMGDNREGSHDSRFLGPIKRRLIHGRILFRIWSNDSDQGWWIFDLVLHPIKFWKQMRWSRFFQIIR